MTATLAIGALADVGVGLYNAKLNQVVTSSTLKWANLKKEAMDNYVVGAESEKGEKTLLFLFINFYVVRIL